MYLKMSSAKWRPFNLGLNVLTREIDNLFDNNAFDYQSMILRMICVSEMNHINISSKCLDLA